MPAGHYEWWPILQELCLELDFFENIFAHVYATFNSPPIEKQWEFRLNILNIKNNLRRMYLWKWLDDTTFLREKNKWSIINICTVL